MNSETEDALYRIFAAVSGGGMGSTGEGLAGELSGAPSVDGPSGIGAELGAGLSGVLSADAPGGIGAGLVGGLSGTLSGDTASGMGAVLPGGLSGGTVAGILQAATGTQGGGGVGSVAMDVLKSGLGLVPLVGAILGLFGGGGSDAPAPLVKYAMPDPVQFAGAETAGGIGSADYGQDGMVRAYRSNTYAGSPTFNGQPGGQASLPQISVNVQAMDARSFLDRSSEIAAAVREAMLNLNSINDVVNDL